MNPLRIGTRLVGPGGKAYVIAELSANHQHDFTHAARLVEAAAEAGADAVKLQTYTADTITLDSRRKEFQIGEGTLWSGRYLHDLYAEAAMPWDWQPRLKELAEGLGMDCFSTPFDFSSVEFLEAMNVPAWKIASFELVDLPLIRRVARTGKPVIISTGMASLEEVGEAVAAAREEGCTELALLKCTSSYPARFDQMNLRAIPELAARFQVPVGLSDHSPGSTVPVAAVAVGATIIEKHIKLNAEDKGPDSEFSLDAEAFREMVAAVRAAEAALGGSDWLVTPGESASRQFRRSLFAARDIEPGEAFTSENVRSVRPADGLPPKFYERVLQATAASRIECGTPLRWDLIEEKRS
jgi:N-acetylneuraminate synthase